MFDWGRETQPCTTTNLIWDLLIAKSAFERCDSLDGLTANSSFMLSDIISEAAPCILSASNDTSVEMLEWVGEMKKRSHAFRIVIEIVKISNTLIGEIA
jgi:hypothetical protein